MTFYELLVQLSQEGSDKIHIDLRNKTIKVGRKVIIDSGQITANKVFGYDFAELLAEELDINELYEQYKYSMPSERDNRRHYFKALSASQLTDEQLVIGMPRLEARIRLEAYIMLASMTGKLQWHNPAHWYWVGQDKDFVILKKYI